MSARPDPFPRPIAGHEIQHRKLFQERYGLEREG
jgi:hypothetical protein